MAAPSGTRGDMRERHRPAPLRYPAPFFSAQKNKSDIKYISL